MKAWYDDIDSATLQRIKTYSAFNDAMSKNLMVQTMYEYREKEVQDFKETNHELAETCIARKNRIAELEKENAELKARRPEWHKVADGDFPPTSGEMHAERYPILACTKNGYVTVAIRRKHGRAYEWFCSDYDGNTLYLDKEIIAWCEISKYTEE